MIYDKNGVMVRPSTPTDAEQLAPRLRTADLGEIQACGCEPLQALREGYEISKNCHTIVKDGAPIAMFGVAYTSTPGYGAVWLLGSDDLLTIRYAFLRHSRAFLRHLFKGFDVLGNWVWDGNEIHIKWLKWLGFRFLSQQPIGVNGELFNEFCAAKGDI